MIEKPMMLPKPWKKSLMINAMVLVGIVSIYSCALMPFYADGRKFDKALVGKITEDQTTREDVIRLFGDPLETNATQTVEATFFRYYYVYLGAATVEEATLDISFCGNVVSDYTFVINENTY